MNTIADIGGGIGTLMAEILKANPQLKGTVADLPSVILEARKIIQHQGLEDRCEVIECDFFNDVPSGSDAYLLSNILHDWSDEKCQIILDNCRKAMSIGSKLLIVEMLIPPGNESSIAKLLDLEMMVITGGRERTEVEYKNLIESSGFEYSQVIQTQENIFILEGNLKEE
jgi:16S rRNA G1207 methylase RsmC